MIIKKLDDIAIMETKHNLDVRNLYDGEEALINVITLKPGEQLQRHITPVNVCFYVLEGKGTVEIGDEKKGVEKNMLIESPKDILHCWYNTSDKQLQFMVIKTPKPTAKSIFPDEK
jgi:mannose-6-phosphate isomerase-like protein (cupin superfamily)